MEEGVEEEEEEAGDTKWVISPFISRKITVDINLQFTHLRQGKI